MYVSTRTNAILPPSPPKHTRRSAGQWRQVFVLAGRLGFDATATTRLAAEFADELASNAQPVAAAAVLLHYLGDVDNGVATLAAARCARCACACAPRACPRLRA